MSTASAATATHDLRDPGYGGFTLLRATFTLIPILAGLDKFFHLMVDWDIYLWSQVADVLPGSATQIMMAVGVVEIMAGLAVAAAPRIGGLLVASWLGVIITNLTIVGAIGQDSYWDIALRDFGLMVGALTLVVLSLRYGPMAWRRAGQSAAPTDRHRGPSQQPTSAPPPGASRPQQQDRQARQSPVGDAEPEPTGECFCGCGEKVSEGAYFVTGHDKHATDYLDRILHDGGKAQRVVDHGYGPNRRNLKEHAERVSNSTD